MSRERLIRPPEHSVENRENKRETSDKLTSLAEGQSLHDAMLNVDSTLLQLKTRLGWLFGQLNRNRPTENHITQLATSRGDLATIIAKLEKLNQLEKIKKNKMEGLQKKIALINQKFAQIDELIDAIRDK